MSDGKLSWSSASLSAPQMTLSGRWFIYASPPLERLASRFGTVLPIRRELFPEGNPNIFVHGVADIMQAEGGANVLFFHAYRNLHEKKMEEMILFVLAETLNVERLVVVDPFDGWATNERITQEGQVASANIDAHFWKTIPCVASGRKVLRLIYDQHTLQNRFFYQGGNTTVAFRSGIPLFRAHIESIGWRPDARYAIAFPDEGACKRFGVLFPDFELVVCGKKRDGEKRRITILDGDCRGRNVCIVDDLVRSGGTLIECAKALVEHGASQVNCYVTHGEFPRDSWKRFLPANCPVPIANFWITDSCDDSCRRIAGAAPFSVLSIADDVALFIEQQCSRRL